MIAPLAMLLGRGARRHRTRHHRLRAGVVGAQARANLGINHHRQARQNRPIQKDEPPMSQLSSLFDNNRAWAERIAGRPGLLREARAAAGAAIPVDRLLRQPRAGERDRRPAAGRAVRAPQRRQRRRAHRPQLPVGDAVRGRRAARCEHIIVCGHYGCGGVQRRAARRAALGLVDNWLRHVQDVAREARRRARRACRREPRARPSVRAERDRAGRERLPDDRSSQDAWARGQTLTVHGWIYGIDDGLLRDLDATASSIEDSAVAYRRALALL